MMTRKQHEILAGGLGIEPACHALKNLRRGFFVEFQAYIDGVVWVNGAGVEFDVLNFAIFVDHEGGAARPLVLVTHLFGQVVLLQDAVRSEGLAIHIAEKRESDADFFGESLVGGWAVDANSENLGVACFKFRQISLICLKFLRSTASEGQNVKGEDHGLLTAKVAQLDEAALVAGQGEVWRDIAHFQRRLGHLILRRGTRGQCERQDERSGQRDEARENSLHASSNRFRPGKTG
jgi:hypothetical protein